MCAGRIAAHAGPATNEIFFKPAFEGSILRSIWPLTRPNLAGAGTKFATPATKALECGSAKNGSLSAEPWNNGKREKEHPRACKI